MNLYQSDLFLSHRIAAVETPRVIVDNLKFDIRPYQAEAFKRFVMWQDELSEVRDRHLLFNMATGSGKTMIMAGLMLLLHQQGHRNFLFFVNSTNIIRKTKENFLNADSAKYLFGESVECDGAPVTIREVDWFDDKDVDGINIKFTTIQKLHTELNSHREGGMTLDDLVAHKIALIADEAHHLSAASATQQRSLAETWEGTVENVFRANAKENFLLEFTATVNYANAQIVEKYRDKIIFRYDLRAFREDRYSKEINLIRSRYEEKERILQALILNVYREILAANNRVNLKPVILFKAKQTIAESERNQENFKRLIAELSPVDIEHIRKTAGIDIVQKAFAYFDAQQLSASELVERIQSNFAPLNCISANNEAEKENNQIRLNTLEDDDNPIRAVFAVQKLNEGWDVLNLFDIVRLYETRDGKNHQPGKTTIAEAQLIGRGARYYPFELRGHEGKYTRKFDNDTANELKILEELYYHARDDSRYISELKAALEKTGIYDGDGVPVDLLLKAEFKQTRFYKTGKIVYNKKTYPPTHELIRDKCPPLCELKTAHQFTARLASGAGAVESALDVLTPQNYTLQTKEITVRLDEIEPHVVQSALDEIPFFRFDNLQKCFGVGSTSEFIKGKKFLGKLTMRLTGTAQEIGDISNRAYFAAVKQLLAAIEGEIKSGTPEFKVSKPVAEYVHKIFTDKQIRVKADYADGQPLAANADWYVYNDNYGTPEEKAFVAMFARYFDNMAKKYKEIYLIRNEREVKITNQDGQTFEPDFVLFCKPQRGQNVIYQIYIEPKGDGYLQSDKWKEDFLRAIDNEMPPMQIEAGEYRIYGLPFYNQRRERESNESDFKTAFIELLGLDDKNPGMPFGK